MARSPSGSHLQPRPAGRPRSPGRPSIQSQPSSFDDDDDDDAASIIIGPSGSQHFASRPMSVMETRRTSGSSIGGASGRSTPIVMTAPRPSSSFAPAPPNHYLQHYHPHYRGGAGGRASPSPSLGHVPARSGPSPLFDASGAPPPPPPPHMRRYSHVPRSSRASQSNPASREASRSPSPHESVYRRASAFIPPTGGVIGGGGGGGSVLPPRSRNNSSSPLYIPDRSPDVDIR